MERLGTLIDEIDARAGRIAGIWLARMQKSELSRSPKRASGTQKTNVLDPGSSLGKAGERRGFSNAPSWHPIPIKSPDPPPDILQDASDEERDDLLALHDAAIRAAELFSQHCG